MKLIDKIIRTWRVNVALKHLPEESTSVLDIGCDDGFLLRKLGPKILRRDGVDPRLTSDVYVDGATLTKDHFPHCVEKNVILGPYDAIFALAVFEHFSEQDINSSAKIIPHILSPQGRLIVTVPHPIVDNILDVLIFLRLIDGQATEEHHGFDPDDLVIFFSDTLKLIKRERFQFGLNNVFIFEKRENAANNINAMPK